MIESKCSECGGTGLVPSKALGKFSGKPIPDCYSDCECKEERHDYYQPLRPEDFDFPMSDTFRAYSYEYCGQPDPGYSPEALESTPRVTEVIHRHSEMGQKEFDLLQQTARRVGYLQGEIDQLKTRRKPSFIHYT